VSSTAISLDVARELRAICGEEYVSEEAAFAHHVCLQGIPDYPMLVVKPGSAEEVAAVVRLANSHGLGLSPEGGLTNTGYLGKADIVLQSSRLTNVEHYDHGDLTVGVGAGMTIAQLNAMVGSDNLMFACDPPFAERATVGGVLATASHGPLRHGYGALRDFCIGVRFVTGDGRRAKGGGRVVKNVAGYDLMKLLIGSYGTLAVITSASFKLFPAPRQTRTFLSEFASAAEALRFRDLVVRSPLSPICLELVSPRARKLMRPQMTDEAWVICVRAAGSDAVVARFRKELGSAVTRELQGEDEQRMWRAVSNFRPVPDGADGYSWLAITGIKPTVEITVPPSDVLRVVNVLNAIDEQGAIGVSFIGRVGVGHVLAVTESIDLEVPSPLSVVDDLRREFGANVSVKVDCANNPWRTAPPNLASMRAVKQALDPNNTLRGRNIF